LGVGGQRNPGPAVPRPRGERKEPEFHRHQLTPFKIKKKESLFSTSPLRRCKQEGGVGSTRPHVKVNLERSLSPFGRKQAKRPSRWFQGDPGLRRKKGKKTRKPFASGHGKGAWGEDGTYTAPRGARKSIPLTKSALIE